jgi:hypothetical protein
MRAGVWPGRHRQVPAAAAGGAADEQGLMEVVPVSEEASGMNRKIWGYCFACEAPLVEGMKLNTFPSPEHPGLHEVYCDDCVRAAEARVRARKPKS